MELLHSSGETIAQRYRILDILGQGGSGTTYLAEDIHCSEQVALKALSLRHMTDWKAIALFEREAQVLAQLNHSAIPRYLEYFQVDTPQDRSFYIAQQLAEGKSLAALVQNGWHASQKEVRRIAIQILEILVYLHELTPPVIHRDIKPQNIIRRKDGNVFLVDFGAVQNTYHSTFARSSTVVGTFGYMAPEQFIGQAVPTTDLYSLGATLLFLLTHRSPADLPTDNLKIDFRCLRLQISEEFADWLEKMLEPDVEDRFPSAKEALAELRRKRMIRAKSREAKLTQRKSPISRKALVKLGIAAVAAVTVLNYFKYPILNYLGLIPPWVYQAAERGDVNRVRHYLEQGIDINARDGGGKTQLHWARSPQMAELLIAKGADVNAKDNYGWTPLHMAVGKNNKDLVETLVAKGADVNAKSKLYIPPSHPLDIGRKMRVTSLVFDTMLAFTKSGITPLHMARSPQMARLLIAKGADVNTKNNWGKTPLHRAAQIGSKEMVELLIANGANIVTRDKEGKTPLHLAESKEVATLLIADVNARDNEGKTPLHRTSSKELASLLIAKGANVNAKDSEGKTPLHRTSSKELASLLIAKGANVNAKDNEGKTPLHRASSKEVAQLLIAKGANLNGKNNQGNTPLHELLTNSEPDFFPPSLAGYNRQKEVIKLLIAKGADVNAKNKQGNTLLHEAAWDNKDLVERLIANGADVNARDQEGKTPLHKAGVQQVALLLIAKGAYVTVRDNQGNTLLHKAARNDWNSLVELLLAMNADINAKNNEGETPLHVAGYNKDVAELLKRHGAAE